ncbi:MAG TPA: alpha/beta hydrolase, partial [Acidimicrobiales bacterium]|nr:alpha/beta hydrolase [Acidimicrobiales bacterium]
MAGITTRTIAVGDVELFVHEAGDPEAPLVVLCHGFPELGYSWRHQLAPIAEAGYHVLAPDQRGYGRSSKPAEVTDYDILHLTGDVLGLIDATGHEKAAVIGHDWGSMVVWALALLAPERLAGVIGMSVPFVPRGPMPPIQMIRQVIGDGFFYMVYFQEPGVADAELAADTRRTMTRMLAGVKITDATDFDPATAFADDGRGFVDRMPEPAGLPGWLSQAEVDHYVEEFERSGFTGGINWYRNLDRNWELTPELAGAKVEIPARFIGGAQDPVLLMSPPSIQEGWLTDDRGTVLVDDAGHWVQQEKPAETNEAIL